MKSSEDNRQPLMGTLAWANKTGAKLNESEKIQMARNVASLRAEMLFDDFRFRLGLLKPSVNDLALLVPPDSKLVKDADAFAREMYDDTLWNHCLRTYYFGALVASFDNIKFDKEIFYAAAICHDVGLNQEKAASFSSCCFAHSGAQLTSDKLLAEGHAEDKVSRIGDAISTHLNFYVPISDYPAESTLTAIGATCDIMGAYTKRIAPGSLSEINKRWPRLDMREMGEFLSMPHMKDGRIATIGQMITP